MLTFTWNPSSYSTVFLFIFRQNMAVRNKKRAREYVYGLGVKRWPKLKIKRIIMKMYEYEYGYEYECEYGYRYEFELEYWYRHHGIECHNKMDN